MKPSHTILEAIAREHLGIPTLEIRRSDRLDFYDVSVWRIEAALTAAYRAGGTAAGTRRDPDLPTPFDVYEIHGVREFDDGNGKYCEQVPDDEAAFWSLYGHIPGQGVECIGDFTTRDAAEEVYARITGRRWGQDYSTAQDGGKP
jgi:hypothetical protein